jgi:DNA-binding response OmpR family regulator
MHDTDPAPRIRDPFQLIPPAAGCQGSDDPDEILGRREERRETKQRVLLVEDEFLLSTVLAADLRAAGYDVLGPCATVTAAMEAAQSESFDGAILDINLKGQLVYPVAEELARRRIPFMFLSGYALISMPEPFRARPCLPKPTDSTVVLHEVQNMLRANRVN